MMFGFYFKNVLYLYVSPFSLPWSHNMFTIQWVFSEKKHWGLEYGTSERKVSGKYEELHSLPPPSGNDPEPRASKPTLLTIKLLGHVRYMKLKILYN